MAEDVGAVTQDEGQLAAATPEAEQAASSGSGRAILHQASAALGRMGQAMAALQPNASAAALPRCVFCGRPVRPGERGGNAMQPDASPGIAAGAAYPECRSCLTEAERDALVEAQKRLHASLATFRRTGVERAHVEPEETKSEMAIRLGTVTLSGLGQMLWLVPGISSVAQTVNMVEGLLRCGPFAVYYQEIQEALSLLVLLSQQVKGETPSVRPMDVAELALGSYYLLVERSNAHGLDPLRTQREHLGCAAPSPAELRELAALLPLASPIAYAASAAEAQRQLALLPGGWRLLLREECGPGGQPLSLVALSPERRRAAVLIPGTQSPGDLVTDLQVEPARVRLGADGREGWAHRGMLRAAFALVRLLGTLVEAMEAEGYEVLFVGHSLGGAVAALAALLLRLGEDGMARSATVRAVCYATPACGDARLCRRCEDFVTSVVNCDDVVPRLSFETIQKLRAEMELRRDEFWAFAQQDFEALKDVKNLLELKRRGCGKAAPSNAAADSEAPEPPPAPPLVPPPRVAGAAVHEEAPAASALQRLFGYLSCRSPTRVDAEEVRLSDEAMATASSMEDDSPEPQSIGDVRLFPPGRLVHLYRHCGTRRAAWIKRTHPSLQRIEVELGLLEDHSGEAYKGALEGVLASIGGLAPPLWKPFAEVASCSCCHEAFGWDSVLRSEPHRLNARHHCHACGDVVCNSCCQRRRHLPQLGIVGQVRICDRCFLQPAGAVQQQGSVEGASGPSVPSVLGWWLQLGPSSPPSKKGMAGVA